MLEDREPWTVNREVFRVFPFISMIWYRQPGKIKRKIISIRHHLHHIRTVKFLRVQYLCLERCHVNFWIINHRPYRLVYHLRFNQRLIPLDIYNYIALNICRCLCKPVHAGFMRCRCHYRLAVKTFDCVKNPFIISCYNNIIYELCLLCPFIDPLHHRLSCYV